MESFSSNGKRECADGIYPDRRDGPAAAGGSSETFDNNSRFTLVNNPEVYALKAAPGETTNVIAEHPEAVATLRAADDKWWDEVQPLLVNENVVGPKLNPMKVLDWRQFGGGPDEKLLKRMEPKSDDAAENLKRENRRRKKAN